MRSSILSCSGQFWRPEADGNPALKNQTKKPQEGQSVAHLILDPVVEQVVERAHHKSPQHYYRAHLPPGPRLLLRLRSSPDLLQRRNKLLPVHNGVESGGGFASRPT